MLFWEGDALQDVGVVEGWHELGWGLVLMRDLEAGDYWLRVETQSDGETASVQAALVGLKRSDTGPPSDIIRQYLKKAGLKLNETENAK